MIFKDPSEISRNLMQKLQNLMCNKTRKRETHPSFMYGYSSSSLKKAPSMCLCGEMQRDKTKFLVVEEMMGQMSGAKPKCKTTSFTAELVNHSLNSLWDDSASPCAQLLLRPYTAGWVFRHLKYKITLSSCD